MQVLARFPDAVGPLGTELTEAHFIDLCARWLVEIRCLCLRESGKYRPEDVFFRSFQDGSGWGMLVSCSWID